MRGIANRTIHRLTADGCSEPTLDEVVVEEPLAITLASEPWLTTMRTPGEDEALVAGLLLAEGLIASAADVSAIVRCPPDPEDPDRGDTLDVRPGPGHVFAPETRRTVMNSACGVCGRAQIDDLLLRSRVGEGPVSKTHLLAAPDHLQAWQKSFPRTGAIHAAVLLDANGQPIAGAEDVGRHNAVDKAIGRALLDGHLASASILVVSARAGFEIVQKAVVAGLDAVVAVSGPSSLAIDLATKTGLVLLGFARSGRANLYAGSARLV